MRNKGESSTEQVEIALKPIKYRFFENFSKIIVDKKGESRGALNFAVLCGFIEVPSSF